MKQLIALGACALLFSISGSCAKRPGGNNDRAAHWVVEKQAEASPISLTASDGTGLELTALAVKGVVEPPLAFTEIHMTFENPEARVREGRFEITLPPDAAISRFAMRIDNTWQEAEVVERQAARQVFEDFLHRRQDPALLEKKAGNQFRARVFPIPANARKEIILSYSQEIPSGAYRLPLAGLPEIDAFSVSVWQGQDHRSLVAMNESDFAPGGDLIVDLGKLSQSYGLRTGSLAVARILPTLNLAPAPIQGLTLLVDTSASRAMGFSERVDKIADLMKALVERSGHDFHIRVICFDQTAETVYRGNASAFASDAAPKIIARKPLGASDVGAAFDHLSAYPDASPRVLLLSDGVATAGELGTGGLKAKVRALEKQGVERLDAVVDGGILDAVMLGELVKSGLKRVGVVADLSLPVDRLTRKLSEQAASNIAVAVPGSDWVWPASLSGLQPGDAALIYASLPPSAPLTVNLNGVAVAKETITVPTNPVSRPLLVRAAASAQIQMASHRISEIDDDESKQAFRKKIVDLSVTNRVLSDYTALLVLETEFDYRRFNIDRRALVDILTVGENGLERVSRSRPNFPKPQPVGLMVLSRADDRQGGKGKRHKGEEGQMGRRGASKTDRQFAIRGPADNPDPHMARSMAREISRNSGVLSYLSEAAAPISPSGQDTSNSPTAPSGNPSANDSLGLDPEDALGALMGDRVDENFGYGGLGLRGTGRGGGGESPPSPHGAEGRRASSRPSPQPAREAPSDLPPLFRDRRALGGGSLDRARSGMHEETPYSGRFEAIMTLLEDGRIDRALADAWEWRDENPGDVLAVIALGESLEASGDIETAARAYGAIIDLFPSRADLRRMAGQRLSRLGETALLLVIDTYRQAVAERPDHPSGHRLLGFALLRSRQYRAAFDAVEAGFKRDYPTDRYAGVKRVLKDDLALILAAWQRAVPGDKDIVTRAAARVGIRPDATPSARFVLHWESDANDVDLHVYDGFGGHAFYSDRILASGGRLYADVTTGYGPECFTINGRPLGFPYTFQTHYYRKGPMGYGMGTLQIIEHNGKGEVAISDRPFVVMNDDSFAGLGSYEKPMI